jgi:protein disulfide-isomerase
MAAYADASTPSVYERQPIINALGNVMIDAEMYDDARRILTAELDRSKQPYYFMTGLADIAESEGNIDEAVDWYRKGWEASKGPATRFQWGYYYLAGLIELQPENTELIRDTTVTLISELQAQGGFFQRPKAQLARIESYLIEWGEDNAEALAEIRNSVHAACASADAVEESRATCEAFLGTA